MTATIPEEDQRISILVGVRELLMASWVSYGLIQPSEKECKTFLNVLVRFRLEVVYPKFGSGATKMLRQQALRRRILVRAYPGPTGR
jgi:hypothetical protein